MAVLLLAIPLRAAQRPHAGEDNQAKVVWTNDEIEELHGLNRISIVGRLNAETPASASTPAPYVKAQDLGWYAAEAARMRDQLGHRQAQLDEYTQALEAARSLRETTGGINLDEGELGITPEAGVAILQQRVSETQTELDALEELARTNDISPGILRGQGDSEN
jgi:hypothetical protein